MAAKKSPKGSSRGKTPKAPSPKKKASAKKRPATTRKKAAKKKSPAKKKPSKKTTTKAVAGKTRAPKAKGAKKARPKKAPAKKTGAKKAVAKPPAGEKPGAAQAVPEGPVAAPRPPDEVAEAAGAGTVEEAPVAAPPRPRRRPKMPSRRTDGTITVGYSPDADDAFMFYALLSGKVDTEDRRYELVQEEIQALNEKAKEGIYDVTAISFGAYPYLRDRYLLLTCGASFGDGRGPILVARTPIRSTEVNGLKVAVPGMLTSATLALRLWLPHANLELVEYPFDQVVPAVRSGRARAGVLIHEKQLTWHEENFVRVKDFAQWWSEKTEGLPLPLGANAVRADIPEEERAKIALDIKRSIAYGLGHREEALDYAVKFAKGLERKVVDQYISMYVNELALDYAERGRQAVCLFFSEARRFDFIPEDVEPEFS